MTIFVDFKKLHPDAVEPKAMTAGACGFDMVAVSRKAHALYMEYGTGISVSIPFGYVGLLAPRSSVTNLGWFLGNSVGVIDSDYTGEIKFRFYQQSELVRAVYPYDIGDRLGQLVLVPCPSVKFVEVKELADTERGLGGYGSTGV